MKNVHAEALPPKLDTFMFQQIDIQLMYVTLFSMCELVIACPQLLKAVVQCTHDDTEVWKPVQGW